MSTTQTTTAPAKDAEFTILTRVASIPMIASLLETTDSTLSSYMRSPYAAAKGVSGSVYKFTQPLQKQLAPVINQTDRFANKVVDAVQERCPYPFEAKPEEVRNLVATPAYNVARGVDESFAPIVRFFETRLNNGAGPSTPPDAYQYQRALALAGTMKNNISEYSTEQLKHLQEQNTIVQRAKDISQSITAHASSIAPTPTTINNLAKNMIAELQKLRSSIATSVQDGIHNHIPPQVHQRYADLTQSLSEVSADFRQVIGDDITMQEKVTRMANVLRDRINPTLEATKNTVSELLARGKGEASTQMNGVNGGGSNNTN